MNKQKLQEQTDKVLRLVKKFCDEKLDEEYFELLQKLIAKLNRKRNPPLVSGRPEIWAAAIIHAIGSINFLFDKSFQPYTSVEEINNFFNTSKSSTGNKSKEIRDMLKLQRFDREFSTKRTQEGNPFARMVMVNGFIVDISLLPPELQELVKKAKAEGKDISFRTQK